MTDGRRTPVGDIAGLKNIDHHQKLGALENFGVAAILASNHFADQRDADR